MTSEEPGVEGHRAADGVGGAPAPDPAATFAAPRRLHVAAAAVRALVALRGAALPIVAAVFVGGSGGGMGRAVLFAFGGAAISLVAGVVSWRTTSYQVSGGALRFRTGVLSPDDTAIPIARIQAIDTVQGPLQRLFGAVELHVQTPGGGADGEVVLTAVSPQDARALRSALGHAEPAAPAVRLRLGGGSLLVAALTAPQFGVVLPAMGALFAGVNNVLPSGAEVGLVARVDRLGEAVLVAALLLAATAVLSFASALIAFAGFEVERDGDRLRIRRGIFQRRAASVPVARIDAVAVVEGLLRAPFGLATLRLETAGYAKEQAAARTLFPLVRTRDVPALLAALVPGLEGAPPLLERPPPRSLRRYLLTPALAGGAAGAAIAVAAGGGAAWLALAGLGAGGALHGLLSFRAAGLHLDADRVVLRSRRGTTRVTLLARRRRLQEVSVGRNPLQRRAGLATFALALGSGRRGRVRHLDAARADAAQAALRPPERQVPMSVQGVDADGRSAALNPPPAPSRS